MALRRFLQAAFVAFVACVAAIVLLGRLAPPPRAERAYTLLEVARHASPGDCWLVVHGAVYDATAYAPEHPAPPEVLPAWCGKEATSAFETKGGAGRTHGAAARAALEALRLGPLAQ